MAAKLALRDENRAYDSGLRAVDDALSSDENAGIGHNSGEDKAEKLVERREPESRDKANSKHLASLVIAMSSGTSEKIKQLRTHADDLEQFLLEDAADICARLDSHTVLGSGLGEEVDRVKQVIILMGKRHAEIIKQGK